MHTEEQSDPRPVAVPPMTSSSSQGGDEQQTYTIERQYLAPVYQFLHVTAASVEEACQKALRYEDWSGHVVDYQAARQTEVTVVSLGRFEHPYQGEPLDLPGRVVSE